MADRYWVGGSGDWNNTAKWSTSSGGAGGASVPTSTDNVFVDSNSASGATLDIAFGNTQGVIDVNDFTINSVGYTVNLVAFLAYDGQMNITTRGNVYWNNTVGSGSFANRSFGTVFLAEGGKTVSINIPGAVTSFFSLGFIGSSGSTHNITMANWTGRGGGGGYFSTIYTNAAGTFNFNNSVLRATNFDFQAGTTVNAGSATFTIQDGDGNVNYTQTIASTCTFNANTSTFVCGNNMSRATLNLNGKSLYNLTFNGSVIHENSGFGINITTGGVVNGAFTVDLTSSARNIFLNSNFTINGPFNVTNSSGLRTVRILSPQTGYQLVVNSPSTSLVDIAFQNIRVTGTAAPISGTRIGNLQGCSGITFTATRNCYRIGTGNWLLDQWAATSGGSPNTDYVPLPQDVAIFDQNTTAGTHNVNWLFVSAIDCSLRTSALTLAFGNPYFNQDSIRMYGSLTLGTGITTSGGARLMLINYQNKITITSNGRTLSPILSVGFNTSGNDLTSNGVVELGDALNLGTSTLVISQGTFNTNGYNITANQLSMTSRGIKILNLGSSTITLASTTPIDAANILNATFNSGTSSIVCNATGNITFSGSGFTFYNVSFTGTGADTCTINGANTFNSLSLTAPASTGIRQLSLPANQIITDTLTVAGASAIRRVFVRSDTIATTRTLTVGTLSATDCDFRDITIAGTAAGSSPTRAGNLGGNSGITFPAPKTVYWNLAGAQNWEANAWAATSGGSPSVDNFPLAQDTAVFDEAAGSVTGTITMTATFAISTVNMSARTSAMTLTTSTNAPVVYGNWLFGTGVTSSSTTGTITFAGRGTSTITSNGITFGCPVTVDCRTGTVQLADALVLDSARTLTLTTGTFDAVTYNVTTGLFASSNSNVRTLKMGSGLWTLSGTGTVWNIATSTNLSLQQGTANILVSDTSTTSRTFNGGDQSYNKLTIGGATGTSTFIIGNNNQFTEIASTKTVAHTIDLNTSTQTFGKWSVTGTSGNVVTITGTGTGHILAGPATSGIDYLAMGSIGFAATSPGEFYAGANSTGTAGAPVFRTAPPAARTLYWVGGTGNWNDTARWSLSSGGAGGASVPTSLDNVVFDSASNATGYTVTINQITGGNRIKSWTAAGPASGNVTFSGTNAVPLIIHDNLSFAATGVVASSFFTYLVFSGNQTGRTITTNGVNFNSVIEVNGVGCEWSLGSALSSSSAGGGAPGYTIITNGTLDFNTYNFTSTGLFSQNNNKRTLDFGSGTITTNFLAGITAIGFSGQNFTFVRGTSTYNTPILAGALLSHFYNLTLTDGILAGVRPAINSDIICENNFTCTGTSITARVSLASDTIGVTRTITCASATINNTDIRDITIAGAAAPVSPTGAANAGGNSGITFPAPKTVYRVGTNTTWLGSSSWALTSGGAGSNDNVPLYQDTAVIDNSTALTGTLTISGSISSLDCSTRTTGITLSFSASTWYGPLTLGSGVTVSGTGTQTFSSRSTTMTLTSAGKTITFPITVDALGGTFQIGDATTTSSTVTLTRGTLNLNNYTLTSTTFASNNSNIRTLNFNSGVYALSSTGTIWNIATSTNFTVIKGTGEILLTNTTATGRTFTGSPANVTIEYPKLTIGGTTGSSTLSITGNNSFTAMASTKTVAHTIQLNSTNTRIGTFSVAGTSGNVVTLLGGSSSNPGLFITSGTTPIQNLNYLDLIGMAFYPNSGVWYVGANSTSNASFGAVFETAPVVASGGNMFLLFM